MYLNCLAHDVLPLLRQIQELPRTVVIWQDMPPMPSLRPLSDSRNNFLMGAMNYAASTLLSPIIRVPALAIALPFSEELVAGRSHLFKVVVGAPMGARRNFRRGERALKRPPSRQKRPPPQEFVLAPF